MRKHVMEKVRDKESLKREKELVARCIKGSSGAWEEFVDAYKGLIYNTIIKTFQLVGYRNTEEAADDLFQDVFALLLKDRCAKLSGFRWKDDCSLVFWLGVVTKNLTFDYIRRFISREKIIASLEKDSGSGDSLFKDDASPDVSFLDDIEQKERMELFGKAIKRLSKSEMRLVELLYFRRLSFERAAAVLGKSVDAVYMQKKRVVEKLKTIIRRMSGAREPFVS